MADDRLSADEQTEIVCLMLDREQEGIVRLLRAYAGRVKWLLMSKFDGLLSNEDAEEVIQMAAFKVWKSVDNYNDKGNLGGWFYTFAKNSAIDDLRRQPDGEDRPVVLAFEPEVDPRVPSCLDDEEDLTPQIEKILLEEIETLGEKQKLIIKADMAAGGEANTEELAQRLGISKQQVYSYRNKALTALRKRMEKHGHTAQTQKVNR